MAGSGHRASTSVAFGRREIDKDVSRLVESNDECERPQSAPPLFADGISSGFTLVRRIQT